ncbi:MAG: hypothetical protein QF371_04265, partial [Flavobacteriales bacterium]|nr:hypothetical protein [Flavobacteriales bacterium]
MKRFSKLTCCIALAGLTVLATDQVKAQCGPLTTTYAGNNGQDGIMFDITAVQSVVITSFDIDAYGLTHDYRIYYMAGSHNGFQNNPAAWTLAGTAFGVLGNPRFSPTSIPIPLNILMCAGETYAFYITSTGSSGSISYTNGTGVGLVYSADANIQIKQGRGKDYLFNTSYQPRIPNITCYYDCAMSCCLPPTMSFTPTSCAGVCNGTATGTVGAGGVPPYSYQWDAAAGNQTTQTAVGLCAGTYTLSVTDNTGCTSSGTVTITDGAPQANATISPAGPFCSGSPTINLTAADPGGTWSGTGITNTTLGTFNPAVAGSGTWTITYTIPGVCGDTDTETITVGPNLDATIAPAGPFCTSDAAVNLSAVDQGGVWAGAGITNTTQGTFDPAVAGVGTWTITYFIAGSCGDFQTTAITVNQQLDATINSVGQVCTGDPAFNLTAANSGGTWSGTGITNTTWGTFDPAVAGPGTWTITHSIAGTCGSSDTETITVSPNMNATINSAGPFCTSDPAINLVAVDPGGIWGGSGITNTTLGTFDPVSAGVGTWTITYFIAGGCGDFQTTTITVNQQLDATITSVGPFCTSDPSLNLSAVSSGGTWSGTGITNPALGTFDPSAVGIGNWPVTYTILGACGDTDTEII